MDTSTWLAALHQRISTRRSTLDRLWAWAHVAQTVALADLVATPSAIPTPACWVEPRMAWAMDDLAYAGARTDPFPVPLIDPADVDEVLRTVLRRLIDTGQAPGDHATRETAAACAEAVDRARAALRDYAASTP
jgi:hypothetical protein